MAKKKKAAGRQTFDVGTRLRNIQSLVATNRAKEAIAYQYMLFTMLCAVKYKVKKKPSQSISEYARIVVKEHGLPPEIVYPFVQSVEAIIYGGRQPSTEIYSSVLNKFAALFKEITGKPMPKL